MAQRGWYPDPGGQPGRYRYWDGQAWSWETSADPTTEPPSGSAKPAGRRWPLLLIIAAAVVVILIAVVIRPDTSHTLVRDPNPPVPQVSGWDDSHPLPSPSESDSPTTTPSPSPSQRESFPQPGDERPTGGFSKPTDVDCTGNDPEAPVRHANDGLVHGGGLQFDGPTGENWFEGGELDWSWGYDMNGVFERIDYGHNALQWIGGVRPLDQPESVKAAAQRVMACLIQTDADQGLVITGVDEVLSERTNVDGHKAWLIRTAEGIDDLQHGAVGRLQHVIVVDTGDELSFFIGSVPYPDQQRIAQMEAIAAGLTVS